MEDGAGTDKRYEPGRIDFAPAGLTGLDQLVCHRQPGRV